jgi:curved DNA-binding protein CbpA
MPKESVRVPPGVCKAAKALISAGKSHEGLAAILVGKIDSGGEDVTIYFEHEIQRLISDRYAGLGVETGCEPKDVKKAYRKLVLKYHPDKNAHTTRVFQIVQEAYEVLSDPSKRKEHDRDRRNKPSSDWKPPPPRNKPKPPASKPRPSYASQAPPKPKQSAYQRYQQQQKEAREREKKQQEQEQGQEGEWSEQEWADWNREQEQANNAKYNSKQWYGQQGYDKGGNAGQKQSQQQQKKEWKARQEETARARKREEKEANKRAEQQERRKTFDQKRAQQQREWQQQQEWKRAQQQQAQADREKKQQQQPPPGYPQNLTVRGCAADAVTLEWSSSGEDCVYEMQWRKRYGDGGWKQVHELIRSTACKKKNLETGCMYDFRVRAVGTWGKSPFSQQVTAKTSDEAEKKAREAKRRQVNMRFDTALCVLTPRSCPTRFYTALIHHTHITCTHTACMHHSHTPHSHTVLANCTLRRNSGEGRQRRKRARVGSGQRKRKIKRKRRYGTPYYTIEYAPYTILTGHGC